MAKILCRTKGNSSPKGKPRVFFTCHPEDFGKYFDKLCEDIFASQDCAIYYTEDMTELIEEQNLATDLESNNLFVIPVTQKLLLTPNRAMDFDFPFAREKHIPVLPIMMESGLDVIYSRGDKFGEMQYLDPFSTDLTAISYEEKLKKYLGSILVDDETAKRVRGAFDAYIFLSYRKKDRHLANKLMRMIHSNPEYRDIAIWFDEFLTPGESFRENINKALSDSKLFTLLVTPNLLEENNFVMREEYPAAVASGIGILPAEMEETDRKELETKYEGIPECAVTEDEIAFRNRLLEEATRLSNPSNDTPEHNYLIGLAYLEGIDVEVDRERGIELIISSAEAEYPEAMEKLFNMYREGTHVKLDYNKALYWAKRYAEYNIIKYGEEDEESLSAQTYLAYAHGKVGEYKRSFELYEKVYEIYCRILGNEHLKTITALNNMAHIYLSMGEYAKASELAERVYLLRCRLLGEEHPDTLNTLANLGHSYGVSGESSRFLEISERTYQISCRVLGGEHPDTAGALHNLASAYFEVGEYHKSLELIKKAYLLRCRILGKEHPASLSSLSNLAYSYFKVGEKEKSLELDEKAYELRCKVLGGEHPDTIHSLSNLASSYCEIGDYAKAFELSKKAYELRCKVLGSEHPDTLTTLNNFAYACFKMEHYKESFECFEKAYKWFCENLGKGHPRAISIKTNLDIVRKKLQSLSSQKGVLEAMRNKRRADACPQENGGDVPSEIEDKGKNDVLERLRNKVREKST